MLPHPIHLSPELPLHFVVESALKKACSPGSGAAGARVYLCFNLHCFRPFAL
jgi:hypothetical protein